MENKNNKAANINQKKPKKTPFLRKILSRVLYSLLIPVISVTILFAVFFKITEEKYAKDTLTMVIATSFSQKGIDDETEIIEIKKQMDQMNVDTLAPIDGLNINIERKDIEELSPRDLRLKLFSKISDILYYQNKSEIEKIVSDKGLRENIENAGFITLISKDGHKKLETWFLYSFLASVCLFVAVYSMNKGISRITVPSKAAIFAALPGLIITLGIKSFSSYDYSSSLSGEANFSQVFANIIKNALPQTIDMFFRVYLWVFIIGLSLFLGSKIYLFWKRIFKKREEI